MTISFSGRASFLVQIALLAGMAIFPAYGDESLLKTERDICLPFHSKPDTDRSYVDIPVENPSIVADATSFQIDFLCDRPEAVGSLTLYFRSGAGWYSYALGMPQRLPETANLFRIEVDRSNVRTEGTPGPWDKADTMRFSVWRGADKDAKLTLLHVRAEQAAIAALLPESPEDRKTGQQLVTRMNRIGIPTGTINDCSDDRLARCKVVVLPLNSQLKPETIAMLERFVERGGKIVAFYQLPKPLMTVLGFEPGRYLKSSEGDAALAEVRFEKTNAPEDPFAKLDGFKQKSWNIITARPESHHARIAAWWYDAAGRKTNEPALLLSDRGAFFSHILLNDDPDNQTRFLTALFSRFEPSFRQRQAVAVWRTLFTVGDIRNRTVEQVAALATENMNELKRRGFDLPAGFWEKETVTPSVDYDELIAAVRDMRQEAARRYCASMPSKTPEFRAWWEHAGLGAYHGDWDRTMKELADAGFNAVISNLLWGGSAHYASDVIPRSAKFEKYGDQVEQAIKAGKKYGIQVHAWQVCFRLEGSPEEYVELMRKAGRTQKRYDGTESRWLCPSNPANLDLECDTFCELVRKYPDLSGIHYDYIRYPDSEHCFCDGCRERFTKESGCDVKQWPADVRHLGIHAEKFTQWRCDTISRLVERVHREAKKIRPNIQISAAVFADYPGCCKSIGQDWALWVERGWLDFLCPMDYTENPDQFESWIGRQKKFVDDRIPLYPGIGATATGIAMSPDRVAVEIGIVRQANLSGFVIFNLDGRTIERIPPMLKLGPTSTR